MLVGVDDDLALEITCGHRSNGLALGCDGLLILLLAGDLILLGDVLCRIAHVVAV